MLSLFPHLWCLYLLFEQLIPLFFNGIGGLNNFRGLVFSLIYWFEQLYDHFCSLLSVSGFEPGHLGN